MYVLYARMHILFLASSSSTISGYFIVANRLYLHHISLDGSRSKVAVSGGLSHASAVDFHLRNNSLYWSDSSQHAIMKSTLEGLKKRTVLDRGLSQPGIYAANTSHCN